MIIKKKITINADETIARVEGYKEIAIKELKEQNHQGHCWLWMELKDGSEYISYDDGESWNDIDWGGYW